VERKNMAPKIINVPKTDPGAYNPNRTAGTLLRSQALHMREALTKHAQELKALLDIDMASLKTEADVSAYVHRSTALLHAYAGKSAIK
jgi:hypothetical protein